MSSMASLLDSMPSPLPPPDARSDASLVIVGAEPLSPQAPPSRTPSRPKALGKRRARRREQQQLLERLWEATEDEEEDDIEPPGLFTDYARRMICDEHLLSRFLNGAHLRRPARQAARDKGLCPRAREARRGWLRIERCLRTWLRRYGRHDLGSVVAVEEPVASWLANEPLATLLRVPSAVVDRRVVHALAQFHGCFSLTDHPDFVVLRPPGNPGAVLRHGALIADAFDLLR